MTTPLLEGECLITFQEAAALPMFRRGDQEAHVNKLRRWARKGCNGVLLETVTVGRFPMTSEAACRRFVRALSRAHAEAPLMRCHSSASSRAARARRALAADGL